MLRFSIGKIPVEVRTSHMVFNFVLAFLSQTALTHPEISPTTAILCWAAVISLSVLVHELGHALVSLSFGYQPSIVLVAMGGYTFTPLDKPIPWLKDIALTLAGPLAGYFLASLFWLVAQGLPDDRFFIVHYVCHGFIWANLVWSTFNLVPMGPLDGGRIATVFLTRIAPKRGLLYAQALGLIFGMLILLWALRHGSLFMAVLVGAFMMRSLRLIGEFLRRRSSAATTPTSSASAEENSEKDLQAIEKRLQEGAYAEGLQQAENLLASTLPPEEKARAHYLAGWLSLKSNQGRKAINHFSQAEGVEVPPQAMAAALSLMGEDERALPLWEMAATQSENPTLLHEWAGTLLRLKKIAQVHQMPNIHLAKAYLCAESVFRLRCEYVQAAQVGEASFHLEPQAEVAYEAACNYALAKEEDNALRMLALAGQNGFREAQKALGDPDLLSLHHLTEFQQWLSSLTGKGE